MLRHKPFAESSEQNKTPILTVLKRYLVDVQNVLEIGSGTGQHAVFFAEQFPHLTWQSSDRSEYHQAIQMWIEDAELSNVVAPLTLDVSKAWPDLPPVDAIFSANTAHIMSWEDVKNMFSGIGRLLPNDGVFLLYGPFNYNNQYTSESNARFDQFLHQQDPLSGIRNFQDLDALAQEAGLSFVEDNEMPVNNRLLVWRKE